jgi:L-amino acid N-acyltransferase YncA
LTIKGGKEVIFMLDETIYPKIDLNTYQKEVKLKDGTKILLRPMVIEDQEALYEFFKAVSEEEARYLRDDVKSRLLIESWAKNLDYSRTLPILAIKDDIVIADATINRRRSGWKWHIGTVRIFVHKDYRNRGLGELMVDELARIAYRLGIEKLILEIPDTSVATINAFTKAGFHRAALIPNMAKDRQNMPVDLAVMMKDIKPPLDESYEYDF